MAVPGNKETFWGELAPTAHLLDLYHSEEAFLDRLVRFVAEGLDAGEGVIVIATKQHLSALHGGLRACGVDHVLGAQQDRLVVMDAMEALSRFIVLGLPQENQFRALVDGLLERARGCDRKVRAFGEMVALLWARGQTTATVQLELLWQKLCQEQGLPLLCAYPAAGMTKRKEHSVEEICAAHSHRVSSSGSVAQLTLQPVADAKIS